MQFLSLNEIPQNAVSHSTEILRRSSVESLLKNDLRA